jgi:two-component system, chemotaxis family, response regulator Rcp1
MNAPDANSDRLNPASSRHLRILNIEDNPDDVDLLRLAIRQIEAPVELAVVGDGEAAIDFLKERNQQEGKRPDLIFLDLNLPKKDGCETLAEIKQDVLLRSVPVLIFTTSNSEEHVRQCYTLGAACYLLKPLEFGDLVSLMQKTFSFWITTARLPDKR